VDHLACDANLESGPVLVGLPWQMGLCQETAQNLPLTLGQNLVAVKILGNMELSSMLMELLAELSLLPWRLMGHFPTNQGRTVSTM